MSTCRTFVILAALGGIAGPLPAQVFLTGRVIAAEAGSPIPEARVSLLRSRISSTSNLFGRFSIPLDSLPDTLVVASIGRIPDSVLIPGPPASALTVALRASPIPLSDLIVTAPPGGDLIQGTHWELPMIAVRAVPPAVETDVFRALAMIPAVTFTTPLSSRPIIHRRHHGTEWCRSGYPRRS